LQGFKRLCDAPVGCPGRREFVAAVLLQHRRHLRPSLGKIEGLA
jgi:hypothetical protein